MNIAMSHHGPENRSPDRQEEASQEPFLHVVRNNLMTEELYCFLQAQRNGRPDFSTALSAARNSDGLIRSDSYCQTRIMDAVQMVCLGWEAEVLRAREVTKGRQLLAEYRVAAANMSLLSTRLEVHARFIAASNCGMKKYQRYDKQAHVAIERLRRAGNSLQRFINGQERLLKQSGGNRRIFDRLFVAKMRVVWRDITGRDAGRARTPVVEFAAAVWQVYNFEPRREGSRFAWLADRFKKIG